MHRSVLPTLAALVVFVSTGSARAEDTSDLPTRIGVVPTVGVGVAHVGNASPFPGFIGLTTLGAEIRAEVPPYGGFFRFQFHSSGDGGKWNAPSFALGGSYRFFGDGVERLALLGRGGFVWERWHATTGNCPVDLFVPTNCKSLEAPPQSGVVTSAPPTVTVTGDNLGLFAGARLEMPVPFMFLALDAELAGLVDVAESMPGTVFHARLAVTFGFRDVRTPGGAAQDPSGRGRYQRRTQ